MSDSSNTPGSITPSKGETLGLHAALDLFHEDLDSIERAVMDNILEDIMRVQGKWQDFPNKNEDEKWVVDNCRELEMEQSISSKQKVLKAVQQRIKIRDFPATNNMPINAMMIERAKEYPIEDLYPGQLIRGKGLCPFHQEKTPSFSIKKNRFACFGCQSYGDSIDFYQKLHNCSFVEAVKKLS